MTSRRELPSHVMGIDPSFDGTGIVTLNVDGRWADECLVKTSPSKSVIERSQLIWEKVSEAIRLVRPQLIVIEGLAFAGKGRGVMGTGYLGYRLREHFEEVKIPYIEPAPTALKKFVTGKGNCAKELILQQVYKRWNMEYSDNNLADAYGLAQLGRAYLGTEPNLTTFQKEVIAVLRKEG